ncbi:hypothetical protein PVAP13_5NG358862 [Panicum virgatum]|uniref:Secreted protein n=1 Tax=Panicum virgatum TaxID=38727 RepID=A0A8T0RV96_PANVG|nr:hypothetical protein PVAP13_5NG358862 [Panicum virgatum]
MGCEMGALLLRFISFQSIFVPLVLAAPATWVPCLVLAWTGRGCGGGSKGKLVRFCLPSGLRFTGS